MGENAQVVFSKGSKYNILLTSHGVSSVYEGSSMTVRYVCVYSITGKLINDLCGLNICSNPFNRLPVSQAKRKIVLTLFKRFYFLNIFIK